MGPTVIALQEVERYWPRSGMVDQPRELGKRLPDYWWVHGANLDLHSPAGFPGEASDRRRQFGNMVMTRSPILGSENVPLPRLPAPQSMRRGALEAVVPLGDTTMRVTSTHLCYLSAETRVAQVEALFAHHRRGAIEGGAWAGEHPSDPTWHLGTEPDLPAAAIVLGDMNFTPNSPEYAATIGASASPFVDLWPLVGRAGGETKTDGRIDQGWATTDLASALRAAWVDGIADGSDHQPVWFEFDL